jgi:hypothetical protein
MPIEGERSRKPVSRHNCETHSVGVAELVVLISAGDERSGDLRHDGPLLTHELLPHARGEERALYPAVEPLLKAHGRATATMSIDHEAIEGYVHRIEDAARARMQAANDERAARDAELVQLLLQLQAIFKLHLLQS